MKNLVTQATSALLMLMLTLSLSACNDKDEQPALPSVQVSLVHMADNQTLQRDKSYTSPAGDTYTITMLRYYLSNVKLINQNGEAVYVEPESYHLIALDGKTDFELSNVPPDIYSKIEFGLGVDEASNLSIDQFGDLDPSNDMVWDWTIGYKFLKVEGSYTGNTKQGGLILHIGENSNFKTLTLDLPNPLDLRQKSAGGITLMAEVNELFQSPHPIDFDEMNTAMRGENARKIAENYGNGFFRVAPTP